MKAYVLDTNTVSYAMRGHSTVLRRLTEKPLASIGISAVTEGELRYGVARKSGATRLQQSIDSFLSRIDVLPWDSHVAKHYAAMRASLDKVGRSVGSLDLLIVAHAVCLGRILVTSDKALSALPGVAIEDWTISV